VKICITGGGTGGHLAVAKALAKEAKSPIFIGSTQGQDRDYFENSPLFFKTFFLETTGVVNKKGVKKLGALWKFFVAFLEARKILKEHNVDAVYSVGGFSAAPAAFGALSVGVPLYIHEQNASIGKLNKILKPFAKEFISAYEKDSPIKGYPTQEEFFTLARQRKELKTIIFLGGSQGARAINELALSVAKELDAKRIKIIHQAGKNDFERVQEEYKKLSVEVELYGFYDDIASLMHKADFAVSRSGASTLWELVANALPAFFVPYPYAASDHQYHNALFLVEKNLAYLHREGEGLKEALLEALESVDVAKISKELPNYAQKDVAKKMIQRVQK